MPDPTRREPKTSPERAELQVSLLNEIGLTLTAMAKEQIAQREVFKCLSLQLQAIDNDLAAKWATRLAQIEERLKTIEHYHGHEQGLLTSVAREVGQRPTLSDIEKANQLLIQQVKRNGRKAGKRKRVKR